MFWTSSGAGARVVLQIVVLAVLARLLMPEDFGVIGAAMVVTAFWDILSQLGLGLALVQRPDLKEEHIRTGFTLSVAVGVLLAASIWLLAPTIAAFFRMEQLAAVLTILALRLPMQGVSAVAEALLQRFLRFRQLAAIEVLSYVAYSVVSVTLAIWGLGVWALVGGQLAFTALGTICFLIIQPHSKSLQLRPQAVKDLAFFSGGITIVRVLDWLALQGDKLVAGRWLGAEALGLYGRAYFLTVTPSSELGKIVERVLFPTMSSVQNERLRLTTAYLRGVGLMALLILPLSAALCVLAPEIVDIVLGADWEAAVIPFQILALGMFFRAGYKMADTLARSKGAVYALAWRHAVYAGLVVAGAWFAHPFGIEGIALAVVTALVVHFLLMTQLSLRITDTSWSEICLAHIPAVSLTGVTVVVVLTVATIGRTYQLPSIAVAGLAVLAATLCALVLSRLTPTWILGRDGAWLLEALWRLR